jgi:hypothetical protein
MREQPYALAYAPSEGKLEILTAPTDMALHPMVREVAERVRSLPTGPIIGGNLFVNPSVAGFFNKEWGFLMDVVRSSHFIIDRLVILSTGAGLSGALSAVEATIGLGLKGIHLYHGLRNVQDLPFRERLDELESSGALALTIIESSVSESSNVGVSQTEGIATATRRGAVIRTLSPVENIKGLLPDGKRKVYVQHAVGLDLTSPGGALLENGATLQNTAFVACGRMALLEESFSILKALLCAETIGQEECLGLLGKRFFTNI